MNKLLPLLFLCIIFSNLEVKAQTQLTDFTYKVGDKSSNPSDFVVFDNSLLFEGTTEQTGRELWITDKNGNTKLLKDIYPGKGNGVAAFNKSTVILNDQLYFIADDGENGKQIWSTKGTEQTTQKITNLPDFDTFRLTLVGNTIYFLLKKNYLLQVWRSDGTSKGTVLIKKDLSIWSAPSFEGTANNLFFFTFQPEGSNDSKVWRSDGTEAGTYPITEELDGNGAGLGGTSALTQYIELNNELYFVARSSVRFSYFTSVGIMKSDGSGKNTVPVKAVHDGNYKLINAADVVKVNNKLYFSFFGLDDNRLFIWESDGSEAGTKKIYDESGFKYYIPSNLSSDENHLVFTGKSNNGETALLKLRLDTYEVEEIKELATDAVKPHSLPEYEMYQINKLSNNKWVLFEPYSATKGWFTDLSEVNTTPLHQLKNVREIGVFNGNAYFPGISKHEGAELWKSDLPFKTPQLLSNINKSQYGLIYSENIAFNNKILFSANDSIYGNELWVYNNVSSEKQLLKDIYNGKESSYPSDFVSLKNQIYFTANTKNYGRQLWQSNGTQEGTSRISNLNDPPLHYYTNHLTKSKENLFFISSLNNQYSLNVTDGVSTQTIKAITDGKNGYTLVSGMVAAGNYVYFATAGNENNLWRSDGTAEGTVKIKALFAINHLTAVNDKVYLTARESNGAENELWKSDGTSAGTILVKDIGEGYSSNPDQLTSVNDKLVFTAYTQQFGREYWITDGTQEGTIQIADINHGTGSSSITNINDFYYAYMSIPFDNLVLNNFLYFSANDGTHGTELWKTDGTATGTVLVSDINKGAVGSFPKNFASNDNKVYFSAYSSASGTEIWTTEGTAATTKQLFDLSPDVEGSTPSNFTFLEDELFFVAEKDNAGRQLWMYKEENVTGINDPVTSEAFTVYPNPASEYLFIRSSNQQIKNIKVYNLQGQRFTVNHEKSGKMDVGNLPAGIYFLKAEVDNKILVQRFIKR